MLEYVHRIAEKVANEPLEDELRNWIIGETEDGHMPLVKKKQTKEELEFLRNELHDLMQESGLQFPP